MLVSELKPILKGRIQWNSVNVLLGPLTSDQAAAAPELTFYRFTNVWASVHSDHRVSCSICSLVGFTLILSLPYKEL